MYLITDRQVMKMNTFVFDEAEKKLRGQRRILAFGRGEPAQVIEVGEAMPVAHPEHGIAHWQKVGRQGLLEEFIPAWVKIRERWLRAGAPGSMISNERPVITPQLRAQRFDLTARERYSAPAFRPIWNVPLLATPEKPRDSWMFPQKAVQPLMAKAREVRRKVLDTFPTLKYLVEGK